MSDLLHIIITSQDGATLNTAGTYCDKDMRIHINMPVGATPQEISTEAEMNALFETAEVGSIYKYVGETGNYEAGAYYAVESDGDGDGTNSPTSA